ncbi:MAG TPA: hypothetical protein VMV86_03760, partial [Methanosarcinales archaeon]|nr:hypothetical protein [Methanosarcinales archaeon]
MRDNRDRWTCIHHEEAKPKISTREMIYWREALKKILKVGLEFEFNLPDQKGTCKGDSNACPCVKMSSDECWTECVNTGKCFYLRSPKMCKSKNSKCKPEMCLECKDYKANDKAVCPGVFCHGFITTCFVCESFDINCKTCENKYDPNRNPEEIRARMHKEMNPSNSYGEIRNFGIHSITTDGSLLGQKGAEVITVGRRVDYWEFFKMADMIITSAVEKGAYINERCSIHMHLLASYFSKIFPNSDASSGVPSQINELEKPMPEIILANFHQLCRRYQNAITWMTTGLDETHQLTRWEKFRVSVLDISAILNSMPVVKDMVSSNAGGNKYGWVNYNYSAFDEKNNVKRLHLEMRVADMLLSPSAVAALACMFHAIMIKAVEISRYGVVEVGDNTWMEQAKTIKNTLMNGTGGYDGTRFSDTKHLAKYYDVLTNEALDLVNQLKHILIKMGPAYDVLEKLAERPCALRRINGDSWQTIEKNLAVVVNEDDKLSIAIDECIDLRYVSECHTMDEWIAQTAKILEESA